MKLLKRIADFFRNWFKHAESAYVETKAVQATPVATTPVGTPVDASSPIPASSQVPSTNAYYNPDRKTPTNVPVVEQDHDGDVLANEGFWLRFPVGQKVFEIPQILDGANVHLEISGAYDRVEVKVYNDQGFVTSGVMVAGANAINFVAPGTGKYIVIVDAKSAGTINYWVK